MKREFTKIKKSAVDEDKIKDKLKKIAVKIAEDPAFKSKAVYLHPEIKEACSQEKERVCWGCAGVNCYIKQKLCQKHNVKKQFFGTCKGKQANIGDLSHYGITGTPPESPTHPSSFSKIRNMVIKHFFLRF